MPKRILITDDALFMRVTLKNMLTADDLIAVGEAVNGQDALEKYAVCRPEQFLSQLLSFR